VFISGALLNFLIFVPYLRAKCSKAGKSEVAKQDLEARLLSGEIQCLEFTRAFYNSFCGLFYFGLVLTIVVVTRQQQI
jgi:hypothetical protein